MRGNVLRTRSFLYLAIIASKKVFTISKTFFPFFFTFFTIL